MNTSKSYLICGNYGATNIGDEAILAGTIQQIQSRNPEATIRALSYNPSDTQSRHEIPANYFIPFGIRSAIRGILKLELFRTIQAIRQCDEFILGGGGLFSNEHWKANAIWSLHARLALFFKKPLHIHAQTVEFIQSKFWRNTVKKIMEKSTAPITVRDQSSIEVLIKMGILKEKMSLVPDPALSITPPNPQSRTNEILISIRPYKNTTPELKKTIIETLTQLNHPNITFIPFQTLNSDDLALMKEIKSKTQSEIKIFTPKSHQEAIQRINQAKGVIAMRLHACIFSALTKTPFIAISYSPKVSSFAKSQNAPIIELEQLTSEKLIELTKSSF